MSATTPELLVDTGLWGTDHNYGCERIFSVLCPQDRAPGRIEKIRVLIVRDSYDFQSTFTASAWREDGWPSCDHDPTDNHDRAGSTVLRAVREGAGCCDVRRRHLQPAADRRDQGAVGMTWRLNALGTDSYPVGTDEEAA